MRDRLGGRAGFIEAFVAPITGYTVLKAVEVRSGIVIPNMDKLFLLSIWVSGWGATRIILDQAISYLNKKSV